MSRTKKMSNSKTAFLFLVCGKESEQRIVDIKGGVFFTMPRFMEFHFHVSVFLIQVPKR